MSLSFSGPSKFDLALQLKSILVLEIDCYTRRARILGLKDTRVSEINPLVVRVLRNFSCISALFLKISPFHFRSFSQATFVAAVYRVKSL